jgi:hypothetical protein
MRSRVGAADLDTKCALRTRSPLPRSIRLQIVEPPSLLRPNLSQGQGGELDSHRRGLLPDVPPLRPGRSRLRQDLAARRGRAVRLSLVNG